MNIKLNYIFCRNIKYCLYASEALYESKYELGHFFSNLRVWLILTKKNWFIVYDCYLKFNKIIINILPPRSKICLQKKKWQFTSS